MNPILKLIIYLPATIIFTIIFQYLYLSLHEGGHYLAAKLSGFKNVKIGYTKYMLPTHIEIDDDELARTADSEKKMIFTAIAGPVLGLIPYAVMYLIGVQLGDVVIKIAVGVLIIWYLVGCWKDFRIIVDSVREMR